MLGVRNALQMLLSTTVGSARGQGRGPSLGMGLYLDSVCWELHCIPVLLRDCDLLRSRRESRELLAEHAPQGKESQGLGLHGCPCPCTDVTSYVTTSVLHS